MEEGSEFVGEVMVRKARRILVSWIGAALFGAIVYGAIIYAAAHFISKYW